MTRDEIAKVAVDEWIEIKTTASISKEFKYLYSKGCKKCKIEHLTSGSSLKIKIRCKECGKIITPEFKHVIKPIFTSLCTICNGKSRKEDLTGKVFGKLTVIQDSGNRTDYKLVIWECLCECGAHCLVSSSNLKTGNTVSCGCSRVRDLTGKVFGRLTARNPTNKRTETGSVIWECLCECGKVCFISNSNLVSGHTKSCGCLNKELVKQRHRDKGNFVKEDHTEEELLEYLKNKEAEYEVYANFNKHIAQKREYLCYLTGKNEWGNIEVHHLQARNVYPNLAYEEKNLVCLRKDIHKEFHGLYGYGNNDSAQFYEFLTLYSRKN